MVLNPHHQLLKPLLDGVIPWPDQMETGDGFLAEGGDAVVHLASFGDKLLYEYTVNLTGDPLSMCANSQSRHHTAVKQAPRQHERQTKKNRLQRGGWRGYSS